MASFDRSSYVFAARLADQAKRYDDVVESMKKVAKMNVELTQEERTLLVLGLKNVIDHRRLSLKKLSSTTASGEVGEAFKRRIERELADICVGAIFIITIHLIPSSSTPESKVIYYKIQGDYLRYLAEIKTGDDKKQLIDYSFKSYQKATDLATAKLPVTDRIRLSLATSLSILYYEMMGMQERGYYHAKDALDDALMEINSLTKEEYKELKPSLEAIREKLNKWAYEPEMRKLLGN